MIQWIDGRPDGPLTDLSFLVSGVGVYEAMRAVDGDVFEQEHHLSRLQRSALALGISWPIGLAQELGQVAALQPGPARLIVILTGGGQRLIRVDPLDVSRIGAPVRLATSPWAPGLPGWVKHTSRAPWLMAAQAAGVDEVLWVSPEGCYLEANRSNLFVVRAGVLCTPPDDGRILPGVTRACLLAVAQQLGLPVREAPVPVGAVDELYVSSTLKLLAPVVALDGQPLPGWGPVGRRLMAGWQQRYGRLG